MNKILNSKGIIKLFELKDNELFNGIKLVKLKDGIKSVKLKKLGHQFGSS